MNPETIKRIRLDNLCLQIKSQLAQHGRCSMERLECNLNILNTNDPPGMPEIRQALMKMDNEMEIVIEGRYGFELA